MTGKVAVLFRLSGDYHEFVSALERMAGKKAVDTNKVGTVVHYDLGITP